VLNELPFSIVQVHAAIQRCKTEKWSAPGLDQIPNAVWCAIHETTPSLLTQVLGDAGGRPFRGVEQSKSNADSKAGTVTRQGSTVMSA